ncbi:MAG: MFS transporter [Planctomycetota bacterium]|jgi:predicted MFS family arabinose efflux permease
MRQDPTPSVYPWYRTFMAAYFWAPVFFLFFAERVSVPEILVLEALYYVAVVLLEVPSGAFSDRVGRRPTLLIATLALVAAYILFLVADGFALLLGAQVLLAVGMAFNSGTDTSLHLDALVAAGRSGEYGPREARVARNEMIAGAVGALAGGAIALTELRWAYALSLAGAAGAFLCVLRMREPPRDRGREPVTTLAHLRSSVGHLRVGALRWLFALAVLMHVLNHVPYTFFQPVMDRLLATLPDVSLETPLVTGVQTALAMLLAAWVAGRSITVRDRFGTGGVLLLAGAIQLAIIGLMAFVVHPVIAIVIVFRTIPRGLMSAPLNAAVAPRIPAGERATYLSLQSLGSRLTFALFLAVTARAAAVQSTDGADGVDLALVAGAVIGVVGLATLALTARVLGDDRLASP